MDLHGGLHGASTDLYGDLHGASTDLHGDLHGASTNLLGGLHGGPWGLHGGSIERHGVPWRSPRRLMELLSNPNPKVSMEYPIM